MENKITIKEYFDNTGRLDFQIKLIAGSEGLNREIKVGETNRPGLTLAGFYDFFAKERIQIFGLGETAYMRQLSDEEKQKTYEKFFSFGVLCCVFTHNENPDEIFLKNADKNNVPVFVTDRDTTRFTSLLVYRMDEVFAQSHTLHGTLVDVFGVGILILGKSGVGKSECALELIERGHRLVADDMVVIKKIDESILMGSGSSIIKHHMEIRGIGIINLRDIYGIRSVRNKKRIELVALLEEWDSKKEYDRLGMEETTHKIMDIDIPYIVVPVRPGRNIPIIIETASLNQRLKKLGIFTAREFDEKIQSWMKTEIEKNDRKGSDRKN